MKKILLSFIIPICTGVLCCRNKECPVPQHTPVSYSGIINSIKNHFRDTVYVTDTVYRSGGTITLQPGSEGKDATLVFINSQTTSKGATNTKNGGNDPELPAVAWTFDGSPGVFRALLEFDLSGIPVNATIVDAKLSLYACSNCSDLGHEALNGEVNTGIIRRVTEAWDENTVTWNTQPAVIDVNQVALAASTSQMEDYTDIDVTALVQDIWADPSTGHGFMISLTDDAYYKRLTFMSSDNTSTTGHPKLVVVYKL